MPMAAIIEHKPLDDSDSDKGRPCSATRRKRRFVAPLEVVLGCSGVADREIMHILDLYFEPHSGFACFLHARRWFLGFYKHLNKK